MTSITQVARRAGVSVATASRVVSEADYPVSPATRERVLDAARALDYVPNALARGLLKQRVPVVGVIVHDIMDPYFSEVVRGVEDGATAGDFLVITCSSERDPDRERSYVRLLRSMRAAAVIFAGSGFAGGGGEGPGADDETSDALPLAFDGASGSGASAGDGASGSGASGSEADDGPDRGDQMARHLLALGEQGAAVVHLSPHAGGDADVGVDNAQGIADLVGALVGLGHRQIAFLAGPRALLVARHRLDGYRRGLAAAGIAPDERLVVHSTFNREGGACGVDLLLAGQLPFTAICCANDLLALGALERLAARGVVVPRDVSVAGFDDISVAALTAPALSTVRLPLREIGRRGFARAARILAGEVPAKEVLPTEVVLRESTAPPPAEPLTVPAALPHLATNQGARA